MNVRMIRVVMSDRDPFQGCSHIAFNLAHHGARIAFHLNSLAELGREDNLEHPGIVGSLPLVQGLREVDSIVSGVEACLLFPGGALALQIGAVRLPAAGGFRPDISDANGGSLNLFGENRTRLRGFGAADRFGRGLHDAHYEPHRLLASLYLQVAQQRVFGDLQGDAVAVATHSVLPRPETEAWLPICPSCRFLQSE